MILSAEDGYADTIVPRLRAAGADLDRIVFVPAVATDDGEERELILPDHLAALREPVAAVAALLVIVDPITAYLTDAINTWRDSDVRRALRPLAAFAEETGCAVAVSRHLTKQTGSRAIYRGGGSIAFTGAPMPRTAQSSR